jgi:hypothetical protein
MKPIQTLALLCLLAPVYGQSIEGPDKTQVSTPTWYQIQGLQPSQSVGVYSGGRDYLEWGPPRLSPEYILFFTGEKGDYYIDAAVMWLENGKIRWTPLSKKVTVTGENPPLPPVPPGPEPPLPPVPPEPEPPPVVEEWQICLFTDKEREDNLPEEQVILLNGLKFRDELKEKGHKFLGCFNASSKAKSSWPLVKKEGCYYTPRGQKICADQWVRVPSGVPPDWWESVDGKPLPRVAFAPKDGGPIQSFPLPKSRDEFWSLLETLE